MNALTAFSPASVLASLVAWDAAGDPDDWDGLENVISMARIALGAAKVQPTAPKPTRSKRLSADWMADWTWARNRAADALGANWATSPGATQWVDTKGLRQLSRVAFGWTIKEPRDVVIPAPCFWPDGVIPEGLAQRCRPWAFEGVKALQGAQEAHRTVQLQAPKYSPGERDKTLMTFPGGK